ncbi:MAG: ATP phosphoribosyltransferase [Alphaproteobacteria bacterium]|nr:ATP phosphoribosyltransferase [Alphaproteobacteria bacterium]
MTDPSLLRLALPKGRMQQGVLDLLQDAGVSVRVGARAYRPSISLPATDVKLLKPRNVVEMLQAGTRDAGFVGADLVAEREADLVEVCDTGLDPVRIVVAAPLTLLEDGALPARPLTIATEYERLAGGFVARRAQGDHLVRSYGATEVFPPDDADLIVDNTATGSTLEANGLRILEVLMRSTTKLYASRAAWEDPDRRARLVDLRLLIDSVVEARRRVMVEINVAPDRLEALVGILPCLREPTVAGLHGGVGFAVKAAVPREQLATLLPRIRAVGGTDIVVSRIDQLVP